MAESLVVYTDGACSGNPGPGGWAWAVEGGPHGAGAATRTTNQRMEVAAALEAVRALGDHGRPLEVVSDSTYVVNCFRDRWWEGGDGDWRNSQRKPVANRDLWEPLVDLVEELGNVTFRWVKGHSGDPMNDLVDRLAVEATDAQAGSGFAGAEAGLAELDGTVLVVGGLRADALGADEHGPLLEAVRDAMGEALAELAGVHPDPVVLSGLRLGAELTGAEAALGLGIPVVAVLPAPDPHLAWAPAEQNRFDAVVARARRVLVLQAVPVPGGSLRTLLGRRDALLVRRADAAVVVHDGHDDRTAALLGDLVDRLGADAVTVVDPGELTRAHR